MVRANTMYHKDWLALNEARHHMREKWAAFFEEWDLLLCPPAASAAFPHDHGGERWERTIVVNGRKVPTTDQLFWAGYPGMAYLPAAVAPCGFTPAGLPVGVQIVAPPVRRRPHRRAFRPPARARVPGIRPRRLASSDRVLGS
jgi:amidase